MKATPLDDDTNVPAEPGTYSLGYDAINENPLISGNSEYIGHRLAIWRKYIDNPSARAIEVEGRGVAMTLVWVIAQPGNTLSRAEVLGIEHGGKITGAGKLHGVPLGDDDTKQDVPFVDIEFGPANYKVVAAVRAMLEAGYHVQAARLF